jgi:protein-glutamine gamma-glutamyltransferase
MMLKVESKLNIYFALMACICGLTFFGTPELGGLPFIAIFFSLFGLIFVDLLRWFALPATMAYVALAAIAFYTINRFLTIGALAAEPQMIAVAELLVLVQSVLMLQRKNRRIYEQLAVFALLELIVAAIFNNAISYGILLLPLGAVAIGALSLLHVYTTSEEAFGKREVVGSTLRISSRESRQSFMEMASPLPRLGLFTIAPSSLLVAFVFFYALPRTNQEARRSSGKTLVGFNSEVRLGQIGKMMLNSEIAARIQVLNRRTGLRYDIVSDLYVRGAVLETYDPLDGTWFTSKIDPSQKELPLPSSPLGRQAARRSLTDELAIKLTVSPMRSESLFSLPPYYFDASGPEILHDRDRWVLFRRPRNLLSRESQITYRFATLGFKDGIQQPYIPRFAPEEDPNSVENQKINDEQREGAIVNATGMPANEAASLSNGGEQEDSTRTNQSTESLVDSVRDILSGETLGSSEDDSRFQANEQRDRALLAAEYVKACLEYDSDRIPSARDLAGEIVSRMSGNQDDPVEVAKAIESFLKSATEFQYTLNLTNEEIAGLDPVEQFLSVDRSGNCQYFASAMVLMLRSRGIPARLVVGFNTDEYNNITGQYIARQLHAHAWVEALIDAQWLKPRDIFYSEKPSTQYWLRLDPTPGGGGTGGASGGRVSDVLDMAQDIWSSYVVEADGTTRRRELSNSGGQISGTYEMYYEWLKLKISRIRAGELGAGSLAGRETFSWPSAAAGILVSLAAVAAYQFGFPRLSTRRGAGSNSGTLIAKPSVAFFAEAMTLLERLGFQREAGQTPKEFTSKTAETLESTAQPLSISSALRTLTSAYYQERFASNARIDVVLASHDANIELALNEVRHEVASRLDDQAKGIDGRPSSGGSIKSPTMS